MHFLLKCKVLRCREGKSGGQNPFDGGILGQIHEHHYSAEHPHAHEVFSKESGLVRGYAHGRKDNSKGFASTTNFRLSNNLRCYELVR